ncbi:MAG: FAD-dependent oxidoreductase [Anaerolineae bacterium]|nr:FAD-dependent oxidoreductase [Anaerolineae bacterium]
MDQTLYDLIVIGGGVTGTGVAHDAALRNLKVLLLERNDFASGTSGACSGMLHGGLRYLISDPEVTRESCIESGIIQRAAPHLIFRIPYLWVIPAGKRVGIYASVLAPYDELAPLKNSSPHVELTREEALHLEPGLTPDIAGALTWDEPGVNPFVLNALIAIAAQQAGATVRNHAQVTAILHADGRVTGVRWRDTITGAADSARARVVVNAAGPWTPAVAQLAGVDFRLKPTRGTHLVFDRRITNVAVRAHNGVYTLPHESTTLLGLTDIFHPGDPDDVRPTAEEIEYLLSGIEEALPAIRQARILRAFAGVRPLVDQSGDVEENLSRRHQVYEHDLSGFITVAGGKMVTYRLMAEDTVDAVFAALGVDPPPPCPTRTLRLPGGGETPPARELAAEFGMPLHTVERIVSRYGSLAPEILAPTRATPRLKNHVCTCEPVTEAEIRWAVRHAQVRTLDDLRRRTRMGVGPCQGMGCTRLAASIVADELGQDAATARHLVDTFLQERWKGRQPVLTGPQVRQEELTRAIYLGVGDFGRRADPPATPVDVLVIGGGLAGTMAALAAADAGQSVALVRKGYGATALSSGGIDIGTAAGELPDVAEALAALRAALAGAGYPLSGDSAAPVRLPTAQGTLKTTHLYPETLAGGVVDRWGAAERLLVVGVPPLAAFDARLVAAELAQALPGLEAVAADVPLVGIPRLDTLPRDHNATPFELARLLDDEDVARAWGAAVRAAAEKARATRVLLPPICGLERWPAAHAALEGAMGRPCFEPLSTPPSTWGQRLQAACETALRQHGVRVVHAAVDGFTRAGNALDTVRATQKETLFLWKPGRVVLATGRFIGGGLACDPRPRETVFALPVFLDGVAVDGTTYSVMLDPQFAHEQALFRAGVEVDATSRPLSALGRPMFVNLYAAGTVQAGWDYATGQGGLGAAAISGYWAAEMTNKVTSQ